MNKKFVNLLIISIFTSILFSCSKPFIAIVNSNFDFSNTICNALVSKTDSNISLKVGDSNKNQKEQNSIIDNFIAEKAKVLVVNPVDYEEQKTILVKANAAEKPLVFFSNKPMEIDSYSKAYYICPKLGELGISQGQMISSYFKKNKNIDLNSDGVIQYVMIIKSDDMLDDYRKNVLDIITESEIKLEKICSIVVSEKQEVKELFSVIKNSYGNRPEIILCNDEQITLAVSDFYKAEKEKLVAVPKIFGVGQSKIILDEVKLGNITGTVWLDEELFTEAVIFISQSLLSESDLNFGQWYIDEKGFIPIPYKKYVME